MINKERGHFLIGFIAWCQSRSCLLFQTDGASNGRPASVLASGSALGSLPSVALSSAQLDRILADRVQNQTARAIWRIFRNEAEGTSEKTDLPAVQAKE